MQNFGDGFVRTDDWGDVDADAMLKSVSENTEADNVKRRSAGLAALHVVGWIEKPHLDSTTNIVRWAFEATDDADGPIANSVALLLGRDGFEKLTWIGPKSAMGGDMLKVAQSSFNFPIGGRYVDFKTGDKVAEYGIAGLVAAVIGAKAAAKVGLVALIAVFAKKAAALIMLPFLVGFGWIERLITRKNTPGSLSHPSLPSEVSESNHIG